MKSYGLILFHLFTWRTVITVEMFLGLLLMAMETGMVALVVVFRQLSKTRFNKLSWQMLMPALNKHMQTES
ncbi:MAG: hypothetical protein V4628_05845 [Pseudomonadota bacterium]